jgi:hypothetical protein
MPSPKRIGSCAYCGREAPITKDHIPPQNLFPDPKPSNLITVPCCEECRSAWSDDDEYFRLAVVSASNQYDGSHAEKVNETVLRSLRKPNKGGFARLVRESLMKIDVRTEAGIYLGTASGLASDRKGTDLFFRLLLHLHRSGGGHGASAGDQDLRHPRPTCRGGTTQWADLHGHEASR